MLGQQASRRPAVAIGALTLVGLLTLAGCSQTEGKLLINVGGPECLDDVFGDWEKARSPNSDVLLTLRSEDIESMEESSNGVRIVLSGMMSADVKDIASDPLVLWYSAFELTIGGDSHCGELDMMGTAIGHQGLVLYVDASDGSLFLTHGHAHWAEDRGGIDDLVDQVIRAWSSKSGR